MSKPRRRRNLSPVQRFRELFRDTAPISGSSGRPALPLPFTQTAVTTFSYIYLLEVAGFSAIAAGIFASNLHATALIGRPVLGIVTDRLGRPSLVLAGIAVVTVIGDRRACSITGPSTPGLGR